MTDGMDELKRRRQVIIKGGGRQKIDAMRIAGRSTARERIDTLLDEDSFLEIDAHVEHRTLEHGMHQHPIPGDGVVCGHGTINGRRVFVFAQDFSVHGGSIGEMHGLKISKTIEMAERARIPLIGFYDGGGQRAHDGVQALGGTGIMLDRLVQCSGRIPTIAVVLGPVAGSSALAVGLADIAILGATHGQLFMSSPLETPEIAEGDLIPSEVGGADMHASRSGIADLVAEDDEDAADLVRLILSHLPDHCDAVPPRADIPLEREDVNLELNSLIPDHPNMPYDMVEIIDRIVDEGSFTELFPTYAENIVIGFAHIAGYSVGIVGNQPKVLAGCLDIDGSVKAARFIRTCDAFNLPIITLEDVPGFLPGTVQEWGGIIRHGAKLLYAYAETSTPKLTVVTRKAYGGAYLAMACKHLQADLNVAWPTAELAVMGAEGAVNIIHRREIAATDESAREDVRTKLVEDYRKKFGDPYVAAKHGWLDDVIEPSETRSILIRHLSLLEGKREWQPPRKHGNIPL